MKTAIILISAALTLSSSTAGLRAEDRQPVTTDRYDKDKVVRTEVGTDGRWRGQHWNYDQLGYVQRANKVLGAKVKGPNGEKVGHIQELAVDLESGRVVEVILSVGGFLGVGDKLVAVPPSSVSWDADQNIQVNADKASLKAAANFDTARWEENYTPEKVGSVYRAYNSTPYFANYADTDYKTTTARDAHRSTDGSVPRADANRNSDNTTGHGWDTSMGKLGYTEKASKIIGMSVKNNANETVGKVDNLLIDLPTGRVVQVVVSAGGFLGIGDELNPIPPSSFRYNPDHTGLMLDVTKESLTQAPRFRGSEWPKAGESNYIVGVYQYYKVNPYFDPSLKDANNSGRNVRDRHDTTLTPGDQGGSQADVDMTRNIRNAIWKTEGLSVSAQNVKIITRGGTVTLRGPVSSEEEKNTLVQIAGRWANPANVDNQLEVKQANVNK